MFCISVVQTPAVKGCVQLVHARSSGLEKYTVLVRVLHASSLPFDSLPAIAASSSGATLIKSGAGLDGRSFSVRHLSREMIAGGRHDGRDTDQHHHGGRPGPA